MFAELVLVAITLFLKKTLPFILDSPAEKWIQIGRPGRRWV